MRYFDRSRVSTSKLLTRESSVSRTAVGEDYYGGSSAAVPFKWESLPGTPKRFFEHSVSDSDSDYPIPAPPLTPPPSYLYPCSSPKPDIPKRNALFGTVGRKGRSRRASEPSSPFSSSSSSWSSSCSVPSSPVLTSEFRGTERIPKKRMWFFRYGSKHSGAGGCYNSIVKVLQRDAK